MPSESGKLFSFHNSGLFSEYYLSNILKEQEEWKTNVKEAFQKINSLYRSQKKELPLLNEDSLEDNFIQPILKELGHTLEPQPSLPPALEGTKRPDLAIFPDVASRKVSLPHQGKEKFFTMVAAICEVKRWGRPLDKKLKTEVDQFEAQNPSLQISRYLWLSGVKWGILTDGRFWRLYERESSKHIDVYYEIDLPELLEKGDAERFKYFALLFRKEAIPSFLDKVQQGSINYAKEVGEDLKKNIYEALKVLAEGFSYLFLMAILNSTFAQRYNRLYLAPRFGDLFTETKIIHLKLLPLPDISFLPSETQRRRLLEKGKNLYERCLAKEDFLCVTGFVDHCLKQKPEQADEVHDLLAFLAEQMIEMNKEKQAEIKGFLEWLEVTIGAKMESLKNKTKIRAYHEGSLEDLLEILKENRKVLKVNPASKDFFDPLKDAFQKSLAKLSPLKNNIATTDRLIDLIVYRLYGLTEEEIKIVEGG